MNLDVVEIDRTGTNYWTLFADLNPAPQTHLTNVKIKDRSSADYAVDKPVLDSYEWRHRIRKTVSPDEVKVKLAGMIGADACCTVADAFAEADVGYRIDAQVIAEPGAHWKLDLSSVIRGAHRAVDEGFGAQSDITTINASYQLDDGAYPGLGNRDITSDGHYGTIKLTPLP